MHHLRRRAVGRERPAGAEPRQQVQRPRPRVRAAALQLSLRGLHHQADPEADPEAGPDPPTAASAAWYTRLAALRRARFAFAAAHAHNRLCEAMLAGSCTEPVTVRYQPMLAFAVTASILASVT